MTLVIVHVGAIPATSYRKCSSTFCPCAVCSTSGWNCTPAKPRERSSNAAIGAPSLTAVTTNPSGAADTESPWLIHTDCSAGRPRNSAPSSTTVNTVPPNSASPVRAT